jgi:hypothetical protein
VNQALRKFAQLRCARNDGSRFSCITHNPTYAILRIAPGEPDRNGVVIASSKGWASSYKIGEEDDEVIFRLKDHPLKVGEYLTIMETDGSELPFRVISCHE